jgi:aminoglycoside phosphotransferase (APT) family kinase protein
MTVGLLPQTRSWVEANVGARIVRVDRLHGGLASRVFSVKLNDGGWVIVKVVTPALSHDLAKEFAVIRFLHGRVHAPMGIASDPNGDQAGVPAMLQTRLPGKPEVIGRRRSDWLDQFVDLMNELRDLPVPDPSLWLLPLSPWFTPDHQHERPPKWVSDPRAWQRISAGLREALPEHDRTQLIHRDLHPGNVLLDRGRWSGTVDWSDTCVGPIDSDVARLRVEIGLLCGVEAADEFLRRCTHLVPAYDYRWDVFVLMEVSGPLPDFLVFNRIGARLTIHQLNQRADELFQVAARRIDS